MVQHHSPINPIVPNYKDFEIVVLEIHSEQDTEKALQILRQRKPVILKLTRLKPEKAQRVVDWMAGGTHAIDGRTLWIGEQTFLFVPSSVQIVSSKNKPVSISPQVVKK
ncbi:protein of unknown function DUF552 [Gloeothece citriformis PCC 7424]|uniref:Cell division protein SepF n=1 Tax=Gloeothece citriformis (strain PCC 7424) TaxID=65393 RepID=B7KAP9_GLOC7|nr:cell division protein SepF [Gloeothece citriformis]ACK68721.1 protein of unknown function DUF552 [Gloeothece citriformis PCC 7424]